MAECLQCQKTFDPYAGASIIRGIENPWEMFCSDECVKTYDYFSKHPWPTQEKYPFCHVCEDHHGPEGGKSTACSNFNPHLSEEAKMALKTPDLLEGAATRDSAMICSQCSKIITTSPTECGCHSAWLCSPDCLDTHLSMNHQLKTGTGKHRDRHGVLSTCPEHEVGACCKGAVWHIDTQDPIESLPPGKVVMAEGWSHYFMGSDGNMYEWRDGIATPISHGLPSESIDSPTTKMDLTEYEDDLKNTVDGWDEEYCAAVYLHLYRRGMRVDKAEGVVERMRRRKD